MPYLDKITLCEGIINYTFHDKRLCCEALKMTGNDINWPNRASISSTNERLARLGDTKAASVLCHQWWKITNLSTGKPILFSDILALNLARYLGKRNLSVCNHDRKFRPYWSSAWLRPVRHPEPGHDHSLSEVDGNYSPSYPRSCVFGPRRSRHADCYGSVGRRSSNTPHGNVYILLGFNCLSKTCYGPVDMP